VPAVFFASAMRDTGALRRPARGALLVREHVAGRWRAC